MKRVHGVWPLLIAGAVVVLGLWWVGMTLLPAHAPWLLVYGAFLWPIAAVSVTATLLGLQD